ncbi:MAG: type I restriction endonuclease subunit R, partial [Clostridia bacterium]|nr:type I restriction endonuclease subunit R [Clostridia bacterium]
MFDEQTLEKITMEMLEKLGYECINGYEMERTDFSKILLEYDLVQAIEKINKGIKDEQIQESVRLIRNLDYNNTILNNKQFTKYLLEGISVPIQENGETRYKTVKIIDFDNISNNTFKAINQYTIIEHSEKRPDIIIFINGMPLVVVELKSTIREEVKLEDGYHQLKGYQEVHIPSLFYYNQFMIVSDGVQARAGTITSPWSRFSEWKKIEDTDEVKENMPTHQTLFNGMFRKDRLLDIINNFILWSDNNKILSAYHQYFGVKKAITSTEDAINNRTGKAGLLWHTQGSGKSFSMIFYAGNMIKALNNPSIVIVTDRNDLDNQLFTTFAKCSDYLKQEP